MRMVILFHVTSLIFVAARFFFNLVGHLLSCQPPAGLSSVISSPGSDVYDGPRLKSAHGKFGLHKYSIRNVNIKSVCYFP